MDSRQETSAGPQPHYSNANYQLRVSSYDRVASTIVSLLYLLGFVVLCLIIIVYAMRVFTRVEAVPITLEEVASTQNPNMGLERDLEPMGAEDAPELAEPQLQETLDSISEAVSASEALLDDVAFDGDPQSSRGKGKGDSRQAGTGGEGATERVPRAQRWEIRFQPGSLKQYAQQLDFFGIELGVLGGDNIVYYAFNLAKSKPDAKSQPPELEQRLYMSWRGGELEQADRQLATRAGVADKGRLIVQFFPSKTENLMATLEKQRATEKGYEVNDIRKTIFAVEEQSGGFTMKVDEQKYFN
ncbi:MAG: hypothetical protein KDA42_18640 [Planctomycetales bacterium]|nr:hypothetical protein [Planctomycetales bacterium]